MTAPALHPGAYFDPKIDAYAVGVLPGHHRVAGPGLALTTLLGSCVAACIHDPEARVGGLNHFLLPGSDDGDSGRSARYGVHAMELLINDLLHHGAQKRRMKAKVFGGARVIATNAVETVGDRNGAFVRDYLESEGIPVLAADLGGSRARRVFFFPDTGRASVLRLPASETVGMEREERRLARRAATAPKAGGVELF